MRLARWLRHATFVVSGCPEITWVEHRLRSPWAEEPSTPLKRTGDLPLAVAVPFEFQSVVGLAPLWPHWPVVCTAA